MDLAWNLAPALTMLVFAARLTPLQQAFFSSTVPYCHVLCNHNKIVAKCNIRDLNKHKILKVSFYNVLFLTNSC